MSPAAGVRFTVSTSDTESAGRKYLRAFLRVAPAAHSVWRAIEARHVATVEMDRPLLDMGCGFGEFAGIFFSEPVDVGIDVRRDDLLRGRASGTYRLLTMADARRLPFPDESFATVMSLSVLEHIPRNQEAVAEAHRVLKRGGLFVFTAPTPKLSEFFFYNRLLRKVGLAPLGKWYADLLNRALIHVSLRSEGEWRSLLEQAGFEIERYQLTIGPRAVKAFDLLLPLAGPSQISRVLFGTRGAARPRWLVNFWERRLARYVEADEQDGCNVFVVARKP